MAFFIPRIQMKIFIYPTLLLVVIFTVIACGAKKDLVKNTGVTQNDDIVRIQDSLSFELCQIYGLDQGIRNSEGFDNKMVLIQSVDTFNFKRVIDFVNTHGFPTKKLVGDKNMKRECVSGAFFAVLQHNPHRLVNKKENFDLFLNETKKGNMTGEYFATILDKYYWTSSKNKTTRRVFYGSQFGKPCIQTKEATNKARIEIGLQPLDNSGFVDCTGEELSMPKERK